MKLLVVKLSAFGDIIHALPALDDLRGRREVRETHWLLDARYAFTADLLPPDVRIHQVRMKGAGRWRAMAADVRGLRREGFDAIVDLQGLIKSAAVARAIGGPVFGFDSAFLPERQAGWLQQPVRFHPEEQHVVQQYRRIAHGPFLDDPAEVPVSPIPYAAPAIHPETRARLLAAAVPPPLPAAQWHAVLHVAGGWETKQLPEASWQALAEGIAARGGLPVFSWGSEAERRIAERLAARGGFALPKRLSMPELCAMLVQTRAVFGADTGVLHLAAALDTPTISFWGPSASWRSGPLGARHRHVESNPECGPCFKRR
ncbi:MAG: glycosyltransferase family 9 protein, partial [Mariprofundaceae bacterium]